MKRDKLKILVNVLLKTFNKMKFTAILGQEKAISTVKNPKQKKNHKRKFKSGNKQ